MRAFHLSWIAFFTTFVSTFGPAALITVIRDDCNMTKTDIGNAGIAAVCGAVLGRVAMGNFVGEYWPLGRSSCYCTPASKYPAM